MKSVCVGVRVCVWKQMFYSHWLFPLYTKQTKDLEQTQWQNVYVINNKAYNIAYK